MKRYILMVMTTVALSNCSSLQQIRKDYTPQTVKTDTLLRSDLNVDTTKAQALQNWQQYYTDPLLQDLIRQALENNSDLAIARLRTDEAEASLHAARQALLPSLSANATGGVSKFSDNATTKTYSIGADASWTVDIFGKLSNNKKAAFATLEEKLAYTQAVQVRLIAQLATYYYTLLSLDAKVEVTRQMIESWGESVKAQQALMRAGQADEADVSQSEASLLGSQSTLVDLQQQIIETENSLCALIGKSSAKISRRSHDDTSFLTSAIQQFSKGINVQQLCNRPDVRQAEASLKTAYYNTNAARAAFYPSLTLSGSAGWTNSGGISIVNPGQLLLNAAASLTQPLLNNGQNTANLKIAKAQQQEATITFRQTVLDAGNEVNNALATLQSTCKTIDLEQQQISKLQQAVRATSLKMRYGNDTLLQLIVARQSLLSAQLSAISNRFLQISSYITLYEALGGGV